MRLGPSTPGLSEGRPWHSGRWLFPPFCVSVSPTHRHTVGGDDRGKQCPSLVRALTGVSWSFRPSPLGGGQAPRRGRTEPPTSVGLAACVREDPATGHQAALSLSRCGGGGGRWGASFLPGDRAAVSGPAGFSCH